jgi:hypothetical protein
MAQVIISYRRADSAAITGRIRDRLVSTYSASRVFMDVEDIPFGGDFRDHIRHALLRSDLLLVIVGREWLGKVDNGARIQSETDPVRIEVETALQNSIPVIPVLVNGAQIPEPTDLPESLKAFAFLNAATVDAGRDFHAHMDRLIVAINAVVAARRKVAPAHLVGGGPEASRFRVGGWSLATAGFAALLLAAAGWWFFNAPLAATQRTAASAEEKAVAATQPYKSCDTACGRTNRARAPGAGGAIDRRGHLPCRSEGRLWRPASVGQSRDPRRSHFMGA